MIEGPEEAGDRAQRLGVGRPVMPWLYGVVALAGLVVVAVHGTGGYGDFGVLALLGSAPYLVWWAALERGSATPMLSFGRRVAACIFTTLMIAVCHATIGLAVGDALHADPESPLFFALAAVLIVVGAAWTGPSSWRTLAHEPQLVCVRRLLAAITGWAAGAIALNGFAFLIAQGHGTMLAGLLALIATLTAATILGWTVLPWLRLWWFETRTPSAER